jgi:CheY-like chemotaxis protein
MKAILAFSNFLKDPEISHQQRNEYVNYVNSCSISLLHLIDDILDTAKIEAKQLKISQAKCSVNSIINELNVYFQNHKKCKEGDIQLIAKPESISKNYSLVTDSLRLRQILTNLLDNAFKFTDKGKIEFGFDVLDNKLLLFVRDTGIGIPNGKADLVFERFGQVHDNSRKVYKGTGLGLSISKNLVEMLGGSMWVESVEGTGTCFYFTLPYQNMEVSELLVSDTPKAPQIINPTLSWNNYTILVAEDDDLNYKLIQIALNKTKINVCRACNGREVLDILDEKHGHIHAVLMDIQMPVLDGYETTRQLKRKHPLIPVIAQTAFAMTEDKTKCLEAGCDDYISKPLNIEELYAKLTYFLTKRQVTNLSNLS